ncbi:MAG: peptidylprolyl isomerase [Spirochaetales bacterium]|jgi:FKBP-type peptidyl-prolyl cis-trans isomerase SlyD|nr:peptidylprolyl isomerase [Exilispira sp.]NMC67729.1 peptidylprolyl isomerase [Spirochaetales bacterium]
MLVSKNKVVSFFYTVKDDNGVILDQTESGKPFSYLHGAHQIIPGLENELEGKNINDRFSIHVDAENAYGLHDDNLIMTVDRTYFGSEPLEKGLQLQIQSQDGFHIVTVVDFTEKDVTIDANHPLAGVNLNFDIEISDVREATKEELEHGHAHDHGIEDDYEENVEDDDNDIEFNEDENEEDN